MGGLRCGRATDLYPKGHIGYCMFDSTHTGPDECSPIGSLCPGAVPSKCHICDNEKNFCSETYGGCIPKILVYGVGIGLIYLMMKKK